MIDWFEQLTGFREEPYEITQSRLRVEGEYLHPEGSTRTYRIGVLEVPTLAELRGKLPVSAYSECLQFEHVKGDVRELHRASASAGALFQVASQFNLLEMVGPEVSPEDGVTRYAWDRTQGPACAISAGAATLYRNYLVPLGGGIGQTARRQIDTLADLRAALAAELRMAEADLWSMKNGYIVARSRPIQAAGEWIRSASEAQRDRLRRSIRIGIHWNVEVTDRPEVPGTIVSQAFCSAIPVSYSAVSEDDWEPLGRLVLEAAYEATLSAGILNAAKGGSKHVYLTRLGGGAFGNPPGWIEDAMKRSTKIFADHDIEARLVQYGR